MNAFFSSENGPDDGQAPLGYPQEQYEDGGPPLFLSRSEDIRAGDSQSAYYGRSFCGVHPPKKTRVPSAFMLSYCDGSTCIIILKKNPHIEKHASALLVQPRWFN